MSVGIRTEIAGGWYPGVYLVLELLGLVMQIVSHSLYADKGIIICLQEVLERDMSHLRENTMVGGCDGQNNNAA